MQQLSSPKFAERVVLLRFAVTAPYPVLAVIDGTLSHLTRDGASVATLSPLATAVIEFQRGDLCIYVREHPFGLLPGIPNLYCVDTTLRLLWMAEWPNPADPCARILGVKDETLLTETMSGTIVELDAYNGRLLAVRHPMAATA